MGSRTFCDLDDLVVVGVEIGTDVFSLVGSDTCGNLVLRRKIKRLALFAASETFARCVVTVDLDRKVRLARADGMRARRATLHVGISRDSVRKMLRFSVPAGYRRPAEIRRPKLDGFTVAAKDVHVTVKVGCAQAANCAGCCHGGLIPRPRGLFH